MSIPHQWILHSSHFTSNDFKIKTDFNESDSSLNGRRRKYSCWDFFFNLSPFKAFQHSDKFFFHSCHPFVSFLYLLSNHMVTIASVSSDQQCQLWHYPVLMMCDHSNVCRWGHVHLTTLTVDMRGWICPLRAMCLVCVSSDMFGRIVYYSCVLISDTLSRYKLIFVPLWQLHTHCCEQQ